MDLRLTEDQQMLKQVVRSFMDREAPKETITALQDNDKGIHPGIWEQAARLGWLGMLIPVEYAGGGNSLTDAAVLYEELGRGPLPGPFFSSGVLGALTVLKAGSEEQRRTLLPAVASGHYVLTVAINEPGNSWGPQGIRLQPIHHGDSYVLNGTKLFVSDASDASHIIVAMRTGPDADDISLLVVDRQTPGVSVRTLPGFLSWQSEVAFKDVRVPVAGLLGDKENTGWAALERALEQAIPVLCAFEVGGSQAVFDMSVRYSQTRVQFGVPIGRFQRVQDHIIRLVEHVDSARWTTYQALWKLDSGQNASAEVHMAKAVASEAYLEACNAAHEVHAGVGSAREYGLVAHTRMSRTLFHFLGDPRWHKRRMVDALAW
jgi:alkylation response protein AidB-like acyl-CoA dehydrogenase